MPDAKLYGPDGVTETTVTDSKAGGVPPEVAKRVKVTVVGQAREDYPPEFAATHGFLRGEPRDSNPRPPGHKPANLVALGPDSALQRRLSRRQLGSVARGFVLSASPAVPPLPPPPPALRGVGVSSASHM